MIAEDGGGSPNAGEVPLSPAQEAMYFLFRLAPQSPAYNTSSPAMIRGALDVPKLRGACLRMCERHAQLTVRFELGPEGPRAFAGAGPVAFETFDARDWSEEKLRDEVTRELRRPFDLHRGPPVRFALFSRGEEAHLFVPVSHHIVFDLWSAALCLEEIGRLYAEACSGEAAVLRAPGDYGAYATALRERLQGEDGAEQAAYWRAALSGIPAARPLMGQAPRPALRGFKGGTEAGQVEPAVVESLRALGQAEGASPLMVLMAAFQLLLAAETEAEDVVATTVVHGRDRPRYRDTVGLFINTLAVRTRPERALSFRAFLGQTRNATYGALRNAAYPFHQALEPLSEAARQTVSQYQLAYQGSGRIDLAGFSAVYSGMPGATLRVGGLTLEAVDLTAEEGQFDLHLLAYDTGAGYAIQLKYDAELFSATTARRLCQRFISLLSRAVTAPEQTLGELAAGSAEVAQLSDDDVTALLLELAAHPDRSGA